MVSYPVSGRCNPLLGVYLHPVFDVDIPYFSWIIALITQFIPSESSLVYPVVVGNDCFSPELVIIIYLLPGIPGVPSFLLSIMTLVPCGVRFFLSRNIPFSGLPQMFWSIDISHPYTGLRYSFFPSLLLTNR